MTGNGEGPRRYDAARLLRALRRDARDRCGARARPRVASGQRPDRDRRRELGSAGRDRVDAGPVAGGETGGVDAGPASRHGPGTSSGGPSVGAGGDRLHRPGAPAALRCSSGRATAGPTDASSASRSTQPPCVLFKGSQRRRHGARRHGEQDHVVRWMGQVDAATQAILESNKLADDPERRTRSYEALLQVQQPAPGHLRTRGRPQDAPGERSVRGRPCDARGRDQDRRGHQGLRSHRGHAGRRHPEGPRAGARAARSHLHVHVDADERLLQGEPAVHLRHRAPELDRVRDPDRRVHRQAARGPKGEVGRRRSQPDPGIPNEDAEVRPALRRG